MNLKDGMTQRKRFPRELVKIKEFKTVCTVFGALPNGEIMLFKGYNCALTSSEMPLPDPDPVCSWHMF